MDTLDIMGTLVFSSLEKVMLILSFQMTHLSYVGKRFFS